jgi:Raf kinase inhibitor-like YbhB/YbcL family protein
VVERHFASHLLAAGIGLAGLGAAQLASAADFLLTSPAFKDGGMLTLKNAGNQKERNPNCVGENVSPPLQWSGAPADTKSFVLLMFDPEGRGGLGVSHWVAYGIPPSATGFAEGEVSKESPNYVGGKSLMGVGSYSGPCTPAGTGYHHYTFTLIATDLDPKALQPGLTREEVLEAIKGHVKSATGLIGLFTKPSG